MGELSPLPGNHVKFWPVASDIEDTLLGLFITRIGGSGRKFSKTDVKRVYFGNWLRDYSQAVDVSAVHSMRALD